MNELFKITFKEKTLCYLNLRDTIDMIYQLYHDEIYDKNGYITLTEQNFIDEKVNEIENTLIKIPYCIKYSLGHFCITKVKNEEKIIF